MNNPFGSSNSGNNPPSSLFSKPSESSNVFSSQPSGNPFGKSNVFQTDSGSKNVFGRSDNVNKIPETNPNVFQTDSGSKNVFGRSDNVNKLPETNPNVFKPRSNFNTGSQSQNQNLFQDQTNSSKNIFTSSIKSENPFKNPQPVGNQSLFQDSGAKKLFQDQKKDPTMSNPFQRTEFKSKTKIVRNQPKFGESSSNAFQERSRSLKQQQTKIFQKINALKGKSENKFAPSNFNNPDLFKNPPPMFSSNVKQDSAPKKFGDSSFNNPDLFKNPPPVFQSVDKQNQEKSLFTNAALFKKPSQTIHKPEENITKKTPFGDDSSTFKSPASIFSSAPKDENKIKKDSVEKKTLVFNKTSQEPNTEVASTQVDYKDLNLKVAKSSTPVFFSNAKIAKSIFRIKPTKQENAFSNPFASSTSNNPQKNPFVKPPQSAQENKEENLIISNPSESEIKPISATNQDEKQLIDIMKKRAVDDQDKYEILEARDKLMKMRGMHKNSNVLKGSCPDMCPELERYSRLVKNQLRFYEKLNDTIHHKAVLKEYSRSSADQDVPLPHELRPPSVLNLTMNHVLCNIIDRVDNIGSSLNEWFSRTVTDPTPPHLAQITENGDNENIGDWFEFIWNTTRSIRKDITQQQLTDPLSVGLVEKCARFHIMCAERLVEENSNNFSRKLNDENLTKCLQTLKHMYEDLKNDPKNTVQCPNEPEFQSYFVLMNLNDGDTLRFVSTLPSYIRKSPEIKLSLDLFMALNNNNYVRFFKLVRKSTLLQGCILLRYFYQVRVRALDTVVRTFCPSLKNVIPFSLIKFTSLLGFEDVQSCGKFCALHGLEYNVNSDNIYLNRIRFFTDISKVPDLQRARNLIESKRCVSWSAIINGGPLPQNPYINYKPHNSFDESGFLKSDLIFTSQSSQNFPSDNQQQLQQQQQLINEKQNMLSSIAVEISDSFVGEFVDKEVVDLASNSIDEVKKDEVVSEISDELLDESLEIIIKDIASDSLRVVRNEELQKRLHLETKLELGTTMGEELISDEVSKMVLEISKDLMKDVEKERKKLIRMNLADELIEDLCSDFVAKELKSIVNEAMIDARKELEQKIQIFQKKRETRLMKNIIVRWSLPLKKRKHRIKILESFPSAPVRLSLGEQNAKLSINNDIIMNKKSRKKCPPSMLFKMIDIKDSLENELLLENFNLVDLISKNQNPSSEIVWKCLICGPSIDYDDQQSLLFLECIKRKFLTNPKSDDSGILSSFTTQNISACVRFINDDSLDEIEMSDKKRRDFLLGSSSVIFLHFDWIETIEEANARFRKLFNHVNSHPPIPVHILSTVDSDQTLSDLLNVSKTISSISHTDYSLIPSDVYNIKWINILASATQSLINQRPKLPDKSLYIRTIHEYVEEFINKNIIQLMYLNLKDRRDKKLPHQNPNALIELYNAGIDHLIEIIQKKNLQNISWPIPELSDTNPLGLTSYWNDPTFITMVVENLKTLYLEKFTEDYDNVTTDWEEKTNIVFRYFEKIKKHTLDSSQFQIRILKALNKSYGKYEKRQSYSLNRHSVVAFIPWTNIIHSCIDYKLYFLPNEDKFDAKSKSIIVGVNTKDYHRFTQPKIWRTHIGWKPEEAENSVLEASLCELNQSSFRLNTQKSVDTIQDELKASNCFEEKLKAALGQQKQDYQINEEENSTKSFIVAGYRDYVPAVSLLSPSMALKVPIKSPLLKYGTTRTQYSPKDVSSSVNSLKRSRTYIDNYPSSKKSYLSSRDCSAEGSFIQDELNASLHFEKRLNDAL